MFKKREIRRDFKKGIDNDAARRKREQVTITLRKERREEQMQKRRQLTDGVSGNPAAAGNAAASADENSNALIANLPYPASGTLEEKLAALHVLVNGIQRCNTSNASSNGLPLNANNMQHQQQNGVVAVVAADAPTQQLQLHCTQMLRKLLATEQNPPIDAVIATGVVPSLVSFLRCGVDDGSGQPGDVVVVPALQFEAAWALTNVSSGTSKHTRCVVDNGAVPLFVSLLRHGAADVREQAVWALGNIAGDCYEFRDAILEVGGLPALLALIVPTAPLSLLRNATWTLSNLCRGKPQPRVEVIAPALHTLSQLLQSHDDEVVTDACWALSYVSDDNEPDNRRIQGVVDAGVCPRLVLLLASTNVKVRVPALRTLGNVVTGTDAQTAAVLACPGVINCLRELLGDRKKGIRKEACWTLSNITAGTTSQIQDVLNVGCLPPLCALLHTAEFDIQKEAAWCVSNACSGGTDEQVRAVVEHAKAIPAMCEMLTCPDARIVLVACEALERMLTVGAPPPNSFGGSVNRYADVFETCGGLDKMEALQRHDNEDVYNKAVKILSTFFEGEDEEEEASVAPTTMAGGTSFAFGSSATAGLNTVANAAAMASQQQQQQPFTMSNTGGFNF